MPARTTLSLVKRFPNSTARNRVLALSAALLVLAFGPGDRSAFGLAASSQGVSGGLGRILLGAHVQPLSSPSTKPQVLAFEGSLGRKLDIDNVYPGFVWPIGYKGRAQWDISGGRTPMFSWSPRVGTGCATFAEIESGKYDRQLNSQAAIIRSLHSTVWLRLFFEPDMDAQRCANPNQNPQLYIAAFRHVVGIFRADGVTNVKWMWAPGYPLYASGHWSTWYPGSDVVDIVAEDTYNATTTQESFSAAVCTVAPKLGKPFAITETGALAPEQAKWLGNIKQACPGLTAFIYFDAVGSAGYDYRLGAAGLAAFKAIGQ
jgi:hypothetical protein